MHVYDQYTNVLYMYMKSKQIYYACHDYKVNKFNIHVYDKANKYTMHDMTAKLINIYYTCI